MNLFFTGNQTAKPQTQNMMPGAREDLGEGLYPLDHIDGFHFGIWTENRRV